MTDDSELLRRYAEKKSQEAFAELVRRRIGLVYSVALRQCGGDAQLAEDVTQTVFSDLARKAAGLTDRPVLSGWLYRSAQFAASDVVRSERRRRAREEESYLMNETLAGATDGTADWEKLRPMIDEAMAELGEEDRDAVALRFFDEKSFAEIGRRLALSEEAARKRVSRAVEKLQGLLARRGVNSTEAALALVLANQAAAMVPTGLAASVTSGALAGATMAAGATIFKIMSTSKIAFGVVAVGAGLAVGIAFFEAKALNEARSALAAVGQDAEGLRAKLRELEGRLEAASKRAAAAEDDNAKLLAAVRNVQTAQAVAAAVPITQDLVAARYKRAQELAKNGQSEEALKEYLWCFDEGMVRVSSYAGVRGSFLLSSLVTLGEQYPPALAALRERRDTAERRMVASATDFDAASVFASINRVLNESVRTLAAFDQLPPGDRRRGALGAVVFDQLLERKSYGDALETRDFPRMSSVLEEGTRERPGIAGSPQADKIREANRKYVVSSALKNVEVLAGAGELADARMLADRLLAYDGSEATRAQLQKNLERAGQPDLLKKP